MTAVQTELPRVLPVFAVSGAILLPGARLPLTVFEPRYLALVDAALGAGRYFALVQPASEAMPGSGPVPGLHAVGTLARITAFGETGDGRYLITNMGITRFRVAGEVEGRDGYRRVVTEYGPYVGDLAPPGGEPAIDRHRLLAAVGSYLGRQGVALDHAKLEAAGDAEMVAALAMAAPLSAEEKQALLEAPTVSERAAMMMTLFEMALLADSGPAVLH